MHPEPFLTLFESLSYGDQVIPPQHILTLSLFRSYSSQNRTELSSRNKQVEILSLRRWGMFVPWIDDEHCCHMRVNVSRVENNLRRIRLNSMLFEAIN